MRLKQVMRHCGVDSTPNDLAVSRDGELECRSGAGILDIGLLAELVDQPPLGAVSSSVSSSQLPRRNRSLLLVPVITACMTSVDCARRPTPHSPPRSIRKSAPGQ